MVIVSTKCLFFSVILQQEINFLRGQRPVCSTEQDVQLSRRGLFSLAGSPETQHGEHTLHMLSIVLFNLLQLHRGDVQSQSSNLPPGLSDGFGDLHHLLLCH